MDGSLEITVDVEGGDILKFNDVWWEVKEVEKEDGESVVKMSPFGGVGSPQTIDNSILQERVDFSGELHLIRKEYRDVIEF
jgi:hypothetical protein